MRQEMGWGWDQRGREKAGWDRMWDRQAEQAETERCWCRSSRADEKVCPTRGVGTHTLLYVRRARPIVMCADGVECGQQLAGLAGREGSGVCQASVCQLGIVRLRTACRPHVDMGW